MCTVNNLYYKKGSNCSVKTKQFWRPHIVLAKFGVAYMGAAHFV